MGVPLFNRRRPSRSTSNAPNRTFMAVDHSYCQLLACQHFGQVQAMVISAVAVTLRTVGNCMGRGARMVTGPKIASNQIEAASIRKLRIRLL